MNKESRIETQVNPSLNMSNGKENINQEKSDLNVMKGFDENHIIIETLLEENCKLKEQNEQLTDYNKSLKRISNFALERSYELAKELYQK
jgi:hypothetical protein